MDLQILRFGNHLYGIKDIEWEDDEEEWEEESFISMAFVIRVTPVGTYCQENRNEQKNLTFPL